MIFVYPFFSDAWSSAHCGKFRFEPSAYAVLVKSEIVVMPLRTRHFLKNISASVSSALVRKFANGGESIPPDVLKELTREERVSLILAVQLLATEYKIKRAKMIVRALVLVAIFSASVISNPVILEVVAEPFYEVLKMFFVE